MGQGPDQRFWLAIRPSHYRTKLLSLASGRSLAVRLKSGAGCHCEFPIPPGRDAPGRRQPSSARRPRYNNECKGLNECISPPGLFVPSGSFVVISGGACHRQAAVCLHWGASTMWAEASFTAFRTGSRWGGLETPSAGSGQAFRWSHTAVGFEGKTPSG